MISLALVVILLAAAASYGSWQLAQYIGTRQRTLSGTLVLCGILFLTAFVMLAVVTATSGWRKPLAAIEEMSAALVAPARTVPENARTEPVAPIARPQTAAPIEQIADPDPLMADWPATYCLKSGRTQADSVGQAYLDNECGRIVAVIYAWCPLARAACSADEATSLDWSYEPAGILMTTVAQRLSSLRLRDGGPLVASTYVLTEPGDQRRRVRFLACYVTAAEVLGVLDAGNRASPQDQRRELMSALSGDACYSRVTKLSRVGQLNRKPVDALLREGI